MIFFSSLFPGLELHSHRLSKGARGSRGQDGVAGREVERGIAVRPGVEGRKHVRLPWPSRPDMPSCRYVPTRLLRNKVQSVRDCSKINWPISL